MSNKLWYKWDEMRRDVITLCRNITLDKFDPQVIVGLSRGGLTAGVMMSHWFQKPFKPVKASIRDFPDWEDYMRSARQGAERHRLILPVRKRYGERRSEERRRSRHPC